MIKKANILESNLFTTRALLHNQSIIPSTGVIQLTLTVKMKVPIPNPDHVNLVFDPLLPFFVLFFKTMFVSFFNLRIILYMCDLGTQLKSRRNKIKGRQSFEHH